MKRFIFLVAFFASASALQAQTAEGFNWHSSAAAVVPTHPVAPGTQLPTEPLSREAMPYVLVFSFLSPLRAAEAVGLGVTSVVLINGLGNRGGSDFDGASDQTLPRLTAHQRAYRSRGSARSGYIFRHY